MWNKGAINGEGQTGTSDRTEVLLLDDNVAPKRPNDGIEKRVLTKEVSGKM